MSITKNNVSIEISDSETPLINANGIEKSTFFKLNMRVALIAASIMLIIFIVRDAIAFIASDLCESLHLTYSEYGIGSSLFTIAYTIFIGPGGMLLSKLEISKATALISFTSGLSSILLALAQDKYHFYVLRFLMGIFQAGLTPNVINYIGLIYPKKYSLFVYALITAVIQFSKPIGAIVSMIFLIMGDNWFFNLYAWQCLLIGQGIFQCLFLFVPYFLLPNNAYDFKQLSTNERNWLLNELESQKTEIQEKTEFKSIVYRIFKNKRFWICSFSDTIAAICYSSYMSFVTLIVSEMLGEDNDDTSDKQEAIYSETCADSSNSALASILSSIPYVFSGIGGIFVGYFGNYIKDLALFICFSQLISSVFIIIWIFIQRYLVIGMIILTFAIGFAHSTFGVYFKLIENLINEKDRLLAFSVYTATSLSGAALGPILVGFAVDFYGFNGGMIVMIVALWISSFLIIFSR